MKIGILGYGKEGKSVENYFRRSGHDIQVFDNLKPAEFTNLDLSNFDLVFRSPSIPPFGQHTSVTKYFFDHCPCQIIGVTGTKGKGTTCSIITALLEKLGHKVWLVGNIGTPALDILDQIKPNNVVVYELSSFQLWDLEKSPHIAVVLRIEPDHLNVHQDFQDYVRAKSNIARHQTAADFCVYFSPNSDSTDLAKTSPATLLPYPVQHSDPALRSVLAKLSVPGQHNQENAEAALLAVAAYLDLDLNDFLEQHSNEIIDAFTHFKSLPHRLEFLRELNHVKYYDDNFSTNVASTTVALAAFKQPIFAIIGGRDKTDNADLPELAALINENQYLHKVVLIGESGHELAKLLPKDKFIVAESLASAVKLAKDAAESCPEPSIVLMSPAAASFDMFENVYDRGTQYQNLIRDLA